MFINRFKDQFTAVSTPVVGASVSFVPCPMMQLVPACQQSQVQAIYQLAAEMTREQLQPSRIDLQRFSLN